MRKLALIMCALSISPGCATMQPLSCDETCSLQDMACEGTSQGYSSGGTYSQRGGFGNFSGNNQTVSCRKPANEFESSQISTLRGPAVEKVQSNDKKRTIETVALVVGVIAATVGGVFLANELVLK